MSINRLIRGIRTGVPGGYVLGRAPQPGQRAGTGPVQLVPLSQLATATQSSSSPGSAGGASIPGRISNDELMANISGSTAAATGVTLSALLDAILGSTIGTSVYRGMSGWTAHAVGMLPLSAGNAGDGTGPLLITDPSGQCIGVPL